MAGHAFLHDQPIISVASGIGIIGVGVSHHHVAEGPAVVDGDTNAEGITGCVDHRFEVTGRVYPVGHSFFCDSRKGTYTFRTC